MNILGKSNGEIPFSSLGSLWCIYLNYDKRSCKSFFECVNLEYIFIDNYTETSSKDFEKFEKAKRIGLMKCKIIEFDAIKNMSKLEHIGIGYNSKMKTLKWLDGNNSLKSVAIQNCKNIKDWEIIGSLEKIQKLTIENCGELPSLNWLQQLTNLEEIRIIGTTSVKDGKIKEIMKIPKLKYLFVPVKKEYDVTLQELTIFNNKP
ncbi:leucine-rich repeat protein [Bacteroides thetaiotaomicron]|nr:leucine-rich repeat protein [Bacteroides thetaiotaomicron]